MRLFKYKRSLKVSGLVPECQSTPPSGVLFSDVSSSGTLTEASFSPTTSDADISSRLRTSEYGRASLASGGMSENGVDDAYLDELRAVDVDVAGCLEDCSKTNDLSCQLAAARKLRVASRDFPKARAAMGAAGAAKALVMLLATGHVELAKESLQALINLTCDCQENRALLPTVAMDALEIVVETLHEEAADVRELAAELVFCLSFDNSNKVELHHTGAVPPLVHMLSGPPSVQRTACKALFNISLVASCRFSIIKADAVEPLMALARHPTSAEEWRVEEKAIMVLKMLATIPEGWHAISSHKDWVQVCALAVRKGSPAAQEAAMSVLADLASRSSERRELVLQEQLGSDVDALAQSGDKRTRQRAMELMHVLYPKSKSVAVPSRFSPPGRRHSWSMEGL